MLRDLERQRCGLPVDGALDAQRTVDLGDLVGRELHIDDRADNTGDPADPRGLALHRGGRGSGDGHGVLCFIKVPSATDGSARRPATSSGSSACHTPKSPTALPAAGDFEHSSV